MNGAPGSGSGSGRRGFSHYYDERPLPLRLRLRALDPRLAWLAALLDDEWLARPLSSCVPGWGFDDEDFAPKRTGLRRSYSEWSVDDDNSFSSHSHRKSAFNKKTRDMDDLRTMRRQFFEPRNKNDFDSGAERRVPVQRGVHERQRDLEKKTVLQQTSDSEKISSVAQKDLERTIPIQYEKPELKLTVQIQPELSIPRDTRIQAKVEDPKERAGGLNKPQLSSTCKEKGEGLGGVTLQDADLISNGAWRELDHEKRKVKTLQEENSRLKDDNLRLKSIITNIEEMNRRWQNHNSARHAYLQSLLLTVEQQQTQLNACIKTMQSSVFRSPVIQNNDFHDSAEEKLRQLQREVADLQRRLEDTKREHKDTIAQLQTQVDSCKDDLEPEHRIKEECTSTNSVDAVEAKATETVQTQSTENISESCHHLLSKEVDDSILLDKTDENNCIPFADAAVPDRQPAQYAFSSSWLKNNQDNVYGMSSSSEAKRADSPCLSDALTPTPHAYPVEVSGSASSLNSASGPGPHVSIPPSSRDTTPDPDISLCSDITLDCSPPSPPPQEQPVQGTLTVGFNSNGLASVTGFRVRPLPTVPGSPEFDETDLDEMDWLHDSLGTRLT